MTTREFDALNLPYPKNILTWRFLSTDKDIVNSINLFNEFTPAALVPHKVDFIHAQFQPDCKCESLMKSEDDNMENLYCLKLTQVHPFLFLRQDFLKQFIKKGEIYAFGSSNVNVLSNNEKDNGSSLDGNYSIEISGDGKLKLRLDRQVYNRFGLPSDKHKRKKCRLTFETLYPIEIDLCDEKMLKPDSKYYTRILDCVKRLPPLKKIYVKFYSQNDNSISLFQNKYEELKTFFTDVIREYDLDGHQPKPLKSATLQNPNKSIHSNRMQRHPSLFRSSSESPLELIDWFGFQIHSLNCTRTEICKFYECDDSRVNVECQRIETLFTGRDLRQILDKINIPSVRVSCLRALIITSSNNFHASSESLLHSSNQLQLDIIIERPLLNEQSEDGNLSKQNNSLGEDPPLIMCQIREKIYEKN